MKHLLWISLAFITAWSGQSQSLQAEVVVNTQKIDQTNVRIFQNLQKALTEFINKTHWVENADKHSIPIQCHFVFTINSYDSGNFSAELQVQAQRPVYKSMYVTSLLNYSDKDVQFSYDSFEPIRYNPTVFESNLTAVIAFYVHVILGLNADSFSENSGTPFFLEAQRIAQLAQSSGQESWLPKVRANRWQLIEDLTTQQNAVFHQMLYQYHRQGLDQMVDHPLLAKEIIARSLISLGDLEYKRTNDSLISLFFDAKSDEVIALFSDGSAIKDIEKLKQTLTRVYPSLSLQWNNLR